MNNTSIPFKKRHTLEERKKKFLQFKERNSELIYCIIEKDIHNDSIPHLDTNLFGFNKNSSFSSIFAVIRSKLKIPMSYALFLFLQKNNTLPNLSKTIDEIYDEYKDEDGFLYIVYTSENTFG